MGRAYETFKKAAMKQYYDSLSSADRNKYKYAYDNYMNNWNADLISNYGGSKEAYLKNYKKPTIENPNTGEPIVAESKKQGDQVVEYN